MQEQGGEVAELLRPRRLPEAGSPSEGWMWSLEACSLLCYTGGARSRADPLTDVQENHDVGYHRQL